MTIDAPLVSLIVVAWNVESYIEQALRSAADQNLYHIEVIVVDNGSSDGTREIIERHKNDPRFRFIFNESNLGLGPGRNQGLACARGDYIAFLDGDDWLDKDAMQIVHRAAVHWSSDIVYFGCKRVHEDGKWQNDPFTIAHFQGVYDSTEKRAGLLKCFQSAWNKLYRRSFLVAAEIQFPNAFYEDIPWAYVLMLKAASVSTVGLAVYNYRQRGGSILRSRSAKHSQAIDMWMMVADYLENQKVDAQFRLAVAICAARQLTRVLSAERLPLSCFREFLDRASDLFDRLGRPKGFAAHHRSLANGSLAGFLYNWSYSQTKRYHKFLLAPLAIFALPGIVAKKPYLKWIYRRYLTLPLKQRWVVFDAYWADRIDCNPMAIYDELLRRGGYRCFWTLKTKVASDKYTGRYSRLKPGTRKYYKIMARAKYFISNVNFPDDIVKRDGMVHVQTKHGTPIKFMGYALKATKPKEMNWISFAERCKRWDFVISSNSYSSDVWRKDFPFNYKVLETGYPRNDLLRQDDKSIAALREKFGIPANKKVLLYAPTFRDQLRDSGKPFEPELDWIKVQQALGPEWVIAVRRHYFENDGNRSRRRDEGVVLDVSRHPYSSDVLAVTDLLVTDYSSIMFDFGCLDRPIILYVPDFVDYRKNRGMYFDIREKPPGPVAQTQNELINVLNRKEFESSASKGMLTAFRREFCALDDGKATVRVVEEIFGASKYGEPRSLTDKNLYSKI